MASYDVRVAIRAYIVANWPEPAVPLVWENESFKTNEANGAWVYLEVYGREYFQSSIGSGSPGLERWVEEGTISAHVMVPLGTGATEASRIAQVLVRLLRGVKLPNDTEFGEAAVGAGDPGDERGKYWRLTATINWERKN